MNIDQELYSRFAEDFNEKPTHYVSSSGRFEVIGNHTDHNGGLCVAASCDLKIEGYAKKRDDNKVIINSLGYESVVVDLVDLSFNKKEEGESGGLVRGIAKYFVQIGLGIGGFSLVTKSSIFKGAGVSSSAAFESLVAQIFNVLYNDGKASMLVLAKAGQFAENNYFGKHSGLLDQSSICFGNISYLSFKDDEPIVKTMSFPFEDLEFVIVNTGGNHAAMSNLYSSIPFDMKSAAKKMGKNLLIESSLEELESHKNSLTEMEYLRSKHFFSENERVKRLISAIESKNKKLFLEQIKGSFISSRDNLQNMMVKDCYDGSPLEACDLAYEFLKEKGAAKINGGGFAGSIIVCLEKSETNDFIDYMSKKYGRENISVVHINPDSPIVQMIDYR